MGEIPRLVVHRSNKFLYAQVVDDLKSHTLAQANTRETEFSVLPSKKGMEAAKNATGPAAVVQGYGKGEIIVTTLEPWRARSAQDAELLSLLLANAGAEITVPEK